MKKASKKCTLHEGCCIEINFFVYSVVLSAGIEKTILCGKTYKLKNISETENKQSQT